MRYLAQFSEAPRIRNQSFWEDAESTEWWLRHEGKEVQTRELTMRSRGTRALDPWFRFQSTPLVIDAWLDPMDIAVTWSYLVRFLAELGPLRVWIPCGDDAWVGWTGQQLTIRAARESWLWALVEDVWDPASWPCDQELEWWAEGRIQHARRLPHLVSEQRGWMTGWEEWTLSPLISEGTAKSRLTALWVSLAERLGARPVRVKWRQETPPNDGEKLLGIPARYVSCDLKIHGYEAGWLRGLGETPDPMKIRTQAVWTIPEWSHVWATSVTLRRVQRGTRLEATYQPTAALDRAAWRDLQHDRRQVPILQIRPLARGPAEPVRWRALEDEAFSHRRREQLTTLLQQYRWPPADVEPGARIRLQAPWVIWRWGSQSGLWVLQLPGGLEVHIEWPTESHPGNVGIVIPGAPPIAMSEWVRKSGFKRLSHDTRYWASWVAGVLLPVLEEWDQRDQS